MKLSTLAVTLFLMSFTNLLSAQDFTPDQVGKLMQASGSVSSSKSVLKSVMNYCGTKFSDLRPTTKKAYNSWLIANEDVLNRSNNMYKSVLKFIKEKGSVSESESFNKKAQNKLNEASNSVVNQFRSQNNNKQKIVCGKWANSIINGVWHVKNKQPSVYKFIMSK